MNNRTADKETRYWLAATLLVVLAIVVSILAGVSRTEGAAAAGTEGEYICPPCGHANEEQTYEKPGRCPVCNMKLVKRQEMTGVAILVFEGVQIIDYTGPYEVFGQGGGFNVFTVSETGKTLTTAMGMTMTPSYSFETSPEPDILIVPGGNVHGPVGSGTTIDWVKSSSEGADHVMSVCNGAFILAKAGLLEGKKATTFYGLIDELREAAPNTEVVTDQRFVDNGKVITTAGLSSGIDGSLYLISKVRGMGRARSVALHIEYDWDPDSDFARAALADMRLPKLTPPEGAEVKVAETGGTRDDWTIRWEVSSDLDREGLAGYVNKALADTKGWTRRDGRSAPTGPRSDWIFLDDDGSRWFATVEVEGPQPASEPKEVVVSIQRDGARKAQAVN